MKNGLFLRIRKIIYGRFGLAIKMNQKYGNQNRVSRVLLDLVVHPSTEPENQVKSALLLNVVIRKGPAILQLLPGEDEPLLVGRDSLLVLHRKCEIG